MELPLAGDSEKIKMGFVCMGHPLSPKIPRRVWSSRPENSLSLARRKNMVEMGKKWHRHMGKVLASKIHSTHPSYQSHQTGNFSLYFTTLELSLDQQPPHSGLLLLGNQGWLHSPFLARLLESEEQTRHNGKPQHNKNDHPKFRNSDSPRLLEPSG